MIKKKLTNLEKFGIIASLIVAGTYFYLNKVYDPQLKKLKKTTKELNKIVGKINSLDELEPEFRYKNSIKKARKELELLDKDLEGMTMKDSSNSAALVKLEKKLISTAESAGLILQEVIPGADSTEIIEWRSYSIKAECTFGQLTSFLENIREFKDPVKIGLLKIDKTEFSGRVKVGMEVQI